MKKYFTIILFIAILCGWSICSSAQTAEKSSVEWGDVVHLGKGTVVKKIKGIKNGKLYLSNTDAHMLTNGDFFSVVDIKNMKNIYEKKMDFPIDRKSNMEIFTVQQKIWLKVSCKEKKKQLIKLYEIDALGDLTGKEVTLAEVDESNAVPFDSSIIVSEDTTKIALIINLNGYYEDENFIVKVFDIDMKLLWEQTVKSPYIWSNEITMKLTNSGELKVISKRYYEKYDRTKAALSKYYTPKIEEIKKGKMTYNFFYNTYSDGHIEEFVIDLGDKFAASLHEDIHPDNGNIILTGLYGLDNSMTVNGFYFIEMEKGSNKIINKFMNIINTSEIKNISKELVEKKGIKEILNIKKVFFKKDGTMLFLTEYATSLTKRSSYNSHQFGYGCVLFNVTTTGKINWSASIPLYQLSIIPLAGSIARFKNDNVYLIYNDNRENLDKPIASNPKKLGNYGTMVEAKIDGNGGITRKIINKEQPDGTTSSPMLNIPLSEDEIIILGSTYKRGNTSDVKIGRIKLVDW